MASDLSTRQLPFTAAMEITADLLAVIPPPYTMKLSIRSDADMWVQIGAGEDGATVDTEVAVPCDADFWWDFRLQGGDDPRGTAPSIFVATMTGAGTLYVVAEP